MDYKKTYDSLIESRRGRGSTSGSTHLHHIVPKSEGGDDEPENLVRLTPREHYIAHLLLAKIYNDQKMWCAIQMMGKRFKHSSRLFGRLMENVVPWNKGRVGCYSEETRRAISDKLKDRPLPETTRKRMSDVKRGKPSNFTGKHHTPDAIQRIRAFQKGRPKSEESKVKSSMTQGKCVLQMDERGNVVAKYWSSNEATRRSGVSNIRRAIKTHKMAGGFYWKYS